MQPPPRLPETSHAYHNLARLAKVPVAQLELGNGKEQNYHQENLEVSQAMDITGLTEFQIEVGVRRAPINEPWEPSTKGREPYFLGEIISILQQKTVCLGGVLK